jgi:hypothetical protein
MLGKSQLKRMLRQGKITCEPITPVSISECSIDVRLAPRILYPKIESENSCYEFRIDDCGGFEVEPVGLITRSMTYQNPCSLSSRVNLY